MGKVVKNGRVYPDELHAELEMTPEEVRQSYIDAGEDPDAIVEALRRMGRCLAAQFAPQVEREKRMAASFGAPLRMFEESVAAGAPAWAEASAPPGSASLMDVMAGGSAEDTFLARVSGWSMRDEGINDGDFVLVNRKLEPKDGDIVLAHIEAEGQVVKRLRKKRGKIVLQSANPDFADIVVKEPSSLRIHGVVVGRAGKLA